MRFGFFNQLNRLMGNDLITRQNGQLRQIQSGIASGALSEAEASTLLQQQGEIASAIEAAKADGYVSAFERADIAAQQSAAQLGIFDAKTNFDFGAPYENPDLVGEQLEQLNGISQGISSGLLDPEEVATLLGEQAGIASDIDAAQADGDVDPFEQLEVEDKQQLASFRLASLRFGPFDF